MSLRPLFCLRSLLWTRPPVQRFFQIRAFRPPHFPRTHRQFTTSSARNAKYFRFEVDPEKPLNDRLWDTGTRVVAGLVVFGSVYYVAHLERVPETGRWRFIDVSPKFEAKMAQEIRVQLLDAFKDQMLPPDHPVTQYVRSVVTRILDSSNLGTVNSNPTFIAPEGVSIPDLWAPDSGRREDVVPGSGGREWDLIVVNDAKMVNAMAAFGTIVVFTGILPIAKDEDGLAAVLGHEIAHVVARHNSERYSYIKVLFVVSGLLEIIGLDFSLSKLFTTILLELPNSRKHELEADKIGIGLSAKACFDPKGVPQMFTRLSKLEKNQNVLISFLDTHPTSKKRIRALEKILPEAYSMQATSPACAGMQENFKSFLDVAGFDKEGLWPTSTPTVEWSEE